MTYAVLVLLGTVSTGLYILLRLMNINTTDKHDVAASSILFIVGFERPNAALVEIAPQVWQDHVPDLTLKSKSMLALLAVTTVTNISTSTLITARLIHAHKVLSRSEASPGYGNSPYINAIVVCVESSAMITCIALVTFISLQRHSGVMVFGLAALPQICVSLHFTTWPILFH